MEEEEVETDSELITPDVFDTEIGSEDELDLHPAKLCREGPIISVIDVYRRLIFVLLKGEGHGSALMDNEGFACIASLIECPMFRDSTTTQYNIMSNFYEYPIG